LIFEKKINDHVIRIKLNIKLLPQKIQPVAEFMRMFKL